METKTITLIVISLLIGAAIGYLASLNVITVLETEKQQLETKLINLNQTYNKLLEQYSKLNQTYYNLKTIHLKLEENYNKLLENYTKIYKLLIILNTTKLVYNGLEIANLTLIEVDGYYNVNGEVRNLGNETMETVYIILFTYNPDGEIANHYYQTLSKLSPGESKTFSFQKALTVNQTFRIFAVGSHGYMDVENTKIMELLTQIEELNQTRIKVQVLTDRDYYYSLSKDIRNANQSILVVMYSMVYDPDDPFDWANNLIRELAEASKRGVNVTVIIEYRTYYGYMSKNLEAYNYLLSQGVNVKLDQEPDTDHLKLVIIDHKIVYIGSHNWSEAALYYNHETSIKIVNKGVANILEQYTQTKF